MYTEEFLKYMRGTLCKLSLLLSSEQTMSLLEISDKDLRRRSYKKVARIGGQSFYIAISAGEARRLLCLAVDIVEDYLNDAEPDLVQQNRWFYDKAGRGVLEEKDLAQEIYREIQRRIIHEHSETIGISMTDLERLSLIPYEGEKADGTLVFLTVETEDKAKIEELLLDIPIVMQEPIEFLSKNLKQIRKLLAGAGREECLLFIRTDRNKGYLLSGYMNRQWLSSCSWYSTINGIQEWTIGFQGIPLFHMKFDKIQIIADPIQPVLLILKEEFASVLPGDENGCNDYINEFEDVLRAIAQQRHGTSVVFLDARTESVKARLDNLVRRKRAIEVAKVPVVKSGKSKEPVKNEVFTNLGRVDGAFIVDIVKGEISYFAVIVDGIACIEGELDRGARHNSLKTFIASLLLDNDNVKAVAAIFSEDGGVKTIQATKLKETMDEWAKI